MMAEKKVFGLIGCGNMGSALVEHLARKNIFAKIYVCDKDPRRQESLARAFGVLPAASLEDLDLHADVILIAVKPQDFDEILGGLKGISGKLIISIAAGLPLSYLEARLGGCSAVVRAMPNLNALVASSVTALAGGTRATEADLEMAMRIFKAIGQSAVVPEYLMDAVTAVSGSGPAFFAYLMDAVKDEDLEKVFIEEAKALGLEDKTAQLLAQGTICGTRKSLTLNFDKETLIKRVASKGGTTEAGLKELETRPKTAQALSFAIRAAFQRAGELGKR